MCMKREIILIKVEHLDVVVKYFPNQYLLWLECSMRDAKGLFRNVFENGYSTQI